MKKRILIDGTPLSHRTDGLSQYIKNVVQRLDAEQYNYTFIVRPNECDKEFISQLQQKSIEIEEVQIAPIGIKREWQFYQYLRKNENRFDAALIPSNQFPLALKVPCLYIVHDLIYEEFPSQLGKLAKLKRFVLHYNVAQGIRKATQIVAVSNYTKNDIKKHHSTLQLDKVNVVYEGWEHLQNIKASPTTDSVEFQRYFIYVGSSRGHKNLARLIDAISLIKEILPTDFGFVFVGSLAHLTREQCEKVQRINSKRTLVTFTGWVSEEQLANYMSNANALIFPSLSEGFGIPVLEAFYYKLPLLLANRTSLPEVAGDAAIYFDPLDVTDMSKKIVSLALQKTDSLVLKKLGTERLKHFSWSKTAKELEQILNTICHQDLK